MFVWAASFSSRIGAMKIDTAVFELCKGLSPNSPTASADLVVNCSRLEDLDKGAAGGKR